MDYWFACSIFINVVLLVVWASQTFHVYILKERLIFKEGLLREVRTDHKACLEKLDKIAVTMKEIGWMK